MRVVINLKRSVCDSVDDSTKTGGWVTSELFTIIPCGHNFKGKLKS